MAEDSKVVSIEIAAAAPATPEEAVARAHQSHAAAVRRTQTSARAGARPTAAKADTRATATMPDARVAALTAWRKSADAPAVVLEAVDAAIKRGTATKRETMPKADPMAVKKFFETLRMTRKEIAGALGISTSVVAVVQNPSPTADRWSKARFDRARPVLLAASKKIAKKTK